MERIFEVTAAALDEIGRNANPSQGKPGLRVAAKRAEDGSIVYGVGFDEARENDLAIDFGTLTVLIGPFSKELLSGATLDFVEVEPGEFQFVFVNPNDPGAGATAPGA